jgi:type II secretory pathway pseudopilin PulG
MMRTRRSQAFTLVELLVAAGITATIAGFILAVAGHMMAAWSRTTGQLGAQAQARLVLDQLALDLQSALYRDDGRVWLAAAVLDHPDNSGLWQPASRQKPAGSPGGSLSLDTADLADARYGQAGCSLCFFTSSRGADDGSPAGGTADMVSAPMAVSYQIIRHRVGRNPAGIDEKYLLYRAVVRPARAGSRLGTLETGFNLDPADSTSGYACPDSTNDGTQVGDPFSMKHPDNTDNVLAENVVDFGVRLYRRAAGGGLQRLFPADGNDLEHLAREPASVPDGAGCFPEAIDVMVRVLTDEGARLIAMLESSPGRLGMRPAQYHNDAEWWWGLAGANSRVFTRRIVLPARWP